MSRNPKTNQPPHFSAAPCRTFHPAFTVIGHYKELQRSSPEVFDASRLEYVYGLGPDQIYVGLDEFDGYVVFVFERTNKAVLECAKTGNALYLFPAQDWKELSRYSKSELLHAEPEIRSRIQRVVHDGCEKLTLRNYMSGKPFDAEELLSRPLPELGASQQDLEL